MLLPTHAPAAILLFSLLLREQNGGAKKVPNPWIREIKGIKDGWDTTSFNLNEKIAFEKEGSVSPKKGCWCFTSADHHFENNIYKLDQVNQK